jgi:hypothetical protein
LDLARKLMINPSDLRRLWPPETGPLAMAPAQIFQCGFVTEVGREAPAAQVVVKRSCQG